MRYTAKVETPTQMRAFMKVLRSAKGIEVLQMTDEQIVISLDADDAFELGTMYGRLQTRLRGVTGKAVAIELPVEAPLHVSPAQEVT